MSTLHTRQQIVARNGNIVADLSKSPFLATFVAVFGNFVVWYVDNMTDFMDKFVEFDKFVC